MVTDGVFTENKFSTLRPVLSRSSQLGIKDMNFTVLTKTQMLTWESCRAGRNVLCRAHTGSGKTLGFLLPTLERILGGEIPQRGNPSVLVISPTRELASQIHTVANLLTRRLNNFTCVCVYGGTNINSDIRKFNNKVDILVATPGRLIDHINRGRSENDGPLTPQRLAGVNVFILDECDRLMDMGFRPDIKRIASTLTNPQRQTLLFSATVPSSILKFFKELLGASYKFIDCVDPNEAPTVQVMEQELIIAEHEFLLHAVWDLCTEYRNKKIIVFSPTARQTQFLANLWRLSGEFPKILEIHSRKSQAFRTKQSNQFRNVKKCIMFSSDVSARGMDYPEVDIIIQIGLMDSKETYIHRLGRSGRAGMCGKGYLCVADFESTLVKRYMQGLPIKETSYNKKRNSQLDNALMEVQQDDELLRFSRMTYISSLGYYNGQLKRLKMSKEELVKIFNRYAISGLGLDRVPGINKRTIGKMGFKGVRGVVIETNEDREIMSRHKGGNRSSGGMSRQTNLLSKKRKLDNEGQLKAQESSSTASVVKKGKKRKTGTSKNNDECWSFRSGNCRRGVNCKWTH